jgi:predicted transcriptional regulator
MFVADRILVLLAERPMSGTAIRAALPNTKRRSIAAALRRMADKGQIESAGWGVYRLAADVAGAGIVPSKKLTVIEAVKMRLTSGR